MRAMKYSGKKSGDIEGMEGLCPGSALCCVFESLGVHDGFEIKQSTIEDFVDYNEVKLFDLSQLQSGIFKAQLNGLSAVLAAPQTI